MSVAATGQATEPMRSSETRLGSLMEDRPCTGCGFNLAGQPIVREPHYSMLMVRCSECGVVAALQEYPLLGRWAGRWAMLLAGAWFVGLLAALLVSSAVVAMSVNSSITSLAGSFNVYVQQQWAAHVNEAMKAKEIDLSNSAATSGYYAGPEYTTLTREFWTRPKMEALFVEAGGWTGALNLSSLIQWIPFGLLCFAVGAFWAVAASHLKRVWLLLVVALVVGCSGTWLLMYAQSGNVYYYATYWGGGQGTVGPNAVTDVPLAVALLGLAAMFIIAGALLGRRATRAMILLLLPPRMRAPLSFLWTCDRLPPPSARA